MYNRQDVDLVKVDGKARGIIARNLITGESKDIQLMLLLSLLEVGGNVYFSTNAMGTVT